MNLFALLANGLTVDQWPLFDGGRAWWALAVLVQLVEVGDDGANGLVGTG